MSIQIALFLIVHFQAYFQTVDKANIRIVIDGGC